MGHHGVGPPDVSKFPFPLDLFLASTPVGNMWLNKLLIVLLSSCSPTVCVLFAAEQVVDRLLAFYNYI